MVYPVRPLPPLPPPRDMYRAYLRNMRYIPDPHVWSQIVPRYKELLRGLRKPLPPIPDAEALNNVKGKGKERALEGAEAESIPTTSAEVRPKSTSLATKDQILEERWAEYARAREMRLRDIRKAQNGLRDVRKAVAVHPHALVRLLERAYGQSGRIRWERMKSIIQSSQIPAADWPREYYPNPPAPQYPPHILQPLPPAIRILTEVYPEQQKRDRLKPLPPCRVRKELEKRWHFDMAKTGVPIFLPENPHGTKTGWEHLPLAETLLVLAGQRGGPVTVDMPKRLRNAAAADAEEDCPKPSMENPRSLPTYAFLPGNLAAVFPRRLRTGQPEDMYEPPRPAMVRLNPRMFEEPRRMDARLLRRTYLRFYKSIPRVGFNPPRANPEYKPLSPADTTTTTASEKPQAAPYPEPEVLLTWKRAAAHRSELVNALFSKYVRATDEEMGWYRQSAGYIAAQEAKEKKAREKQAAIDRVAARAAAREAGELVGPLSGEEKRLSLKRVMPGQRMPAPKGEGQAAGAHPILMVTSTATETTEVAEPAPTPTSVVEPTLTPVEEPAAVIVEPTPTATEPTEPVTATAPKRPRGRPPKVVPQPEAPAEAPTEASAEVDVPSPRPRGRPRKVVDETAGAAPPPKRGRPRKVVPTEEGAVEEKKDDK